MLRQTGKQLSLALVKFNQLPCGRHFKVVTDHRALLRLAHSTSAVTTHAPFGLSWQHTSQIWAPSCRESLQCGRVQSFTTELPLRASKAEEGQRCLYEIEVMMWHGACRGQGFHRSTRCWLVSSTGCIVGSQSTSYLKSLQHLWAASMDSCTGVVCNGAVVSSFHVQADGTSWKFFTSTSRNCRDEGTCPRSRVTRLKRQNVAKKF